MLRWPLCSSLQPIPYSATVLNEYYVPLDNPTSLGIEVGWDDPEVQIPLDFSIDLDGNNSGGILMLGGTGEMLMNTTGNGLLNILWPISLDIMDIGAVEAEEFSSIQYQVTGESPNRILKVEWDNVASTMRFLPWNDHCAPDFQTWIYESAASLNTVLVRTPFLGFLGIRLPDIRIILGFDYDYYTGTFYTASGDANAPDWTLSDDFYQWYYSGSNLSGVPLRARISIRTSCQCSGEAETPAQGFFTYPNPTAGAAWIQNGPEAAEFRVFDASGRSIHTFFLGAGAQAQLPSEAWAAGTTPFEA